jgi:hypothetical protein
MEGALKYLKNNKVAGLDFIVARLLKNGGPRGYCVQCTRRAINSIVKTIEGFTS